MDRYGQKSGSENLSQANPERGFEHLYASFFGSGDRRNLTSVQTPSPAADEAVYPSSLYQQHSIHACQRAAPGSFGQTPNSPTHPSPTHQSKWVPQRQTPTHPKQHQEEPYFRDPFRSIWSMNTNERADDSAGQRLPNQEKWSTSTSYRDSHHQQSRPQMPASNGLAYRGYDQQTFDHVNSSIGSDGGSVPQDPSGYSWSPYDGVNDASITDMRDLHWTRQYPSSQYSTIPSSDSPVPSPGNQQGMGAGIENHFVNEWELQEEDLQQRIREADMKGRQERRDWKKKGINFPCVTADTGIHKQKSKGNHNTKLSLDEKVVLSFLEKYRDKDPSTLASDSSINSEEERFQEKAGEEKSHDGSESVFSTKAFTVEELGPIVGGSGDLLAGESSPIVDAGAYVKEMHSAEASLCDLDSCNNMLPQSVSEEPDGPNNLDRQETISNVDASDLVDCNRNREVRSLSDPVTPQEVLQNKSAKCGNPSRKPMSNGKMRPGKRKPKRKNNTTTAEKSEVKSCRKQTIPTETKKVLQSKEQVNRRETVPKVSRAPVQSEAKRVSPVSDVQSACSSPEVQHIPDDQARHTLAASNTPVATSEIPMESLTSLGHSREIGAYLGSDDCSQLDCSECCALCEEGIDVTHKVIPCTFSKKIVSNGVDDCSSCLTGLSIDTQPPHQSISKPVESSADCVHNSSISTQDCEELKGLSSIDTASSNATGKESKEHHRTEQENGMAKEKVGKGKRKDIHIDSQEPRLSPSKIGEDDGRCKREGRDAKVMKMITKPTAEQTSGNEHEERSKKKERVKSGLENKATADKGSYMNLVHGKSTTEVKECKGKRSAKDGSLFFDPKRIFGGQKPVKIAEKQKKETEVSEKSVPVVGEQSTRSQENKSNHTYAVKGSTGNENIPNSNQCHISRDPSSQQQTAVPSKTAGIANSADAMNGTIQSKELPPHSAQPVPSTSAKDALASKTSTLRADSVSSESPNQCASPPEQRTSTMYSYKKDDKTGALRRLSDPKVEETDDGKSARRDSGGSHSSIEDLKGERRCSGDSHMDGFHHPFGCSAECYKRSSSPSNTQASATYRPSAANQSTASSAPPRTKDFSKANRPQAPFRSPLNDANPGNQGFDAAFAEELQKGLKNPWMSREEDKRKATEEERRQEQEREQQEKLRHHLEKLNQREKQKQQASASQTKRPTRATYSQTKDSKQAPSEQDSTNKEKKQRSSQDRPGKKTTAPHPRRPRPPSDERQRMPSASTQETNNSDYSDIEEDLERQLTEEWWYKLGKKLVKGVCWLVLFSILLCLVVLSFLLAILKDTLKFTYRRGLDLWTWYRGHPTAQDGSGGFSGDDGENGGFGWRSGGAGAGASGGSWGGHQQQQGGARAKRERKIQTHNIDLPATEDAAIGRLLACDPENYYEVVGVAEEASEDDIKKFYRRQCMLVHPDKTSQPRANEAFQILQKAYATLSDQTKRSQYDYDLNYKEQFEEKVEEFFKKMQEEVEEMENTMPCGVCSRSHKRYETDLPVNAARYCANHHARHAVKDGALWKETANFGFKIFVYLCDGDRVYDVTRWAACQNLEWMEANSCQLQCRVKRGRGSGQQRQAPTQGYEDVFDNIFGAGAYQQFQTAAGQQDHYGDGNHSRGSGGHGGHGQYRQAGSRNTNNRGNKKSRKKKK